MNAYTSRNSTGGMSIDVEGMMVDLITIMKATGHTEQMLIDMVKELWPQVEVSVDTTNVKKDA